MIAIMTLMHFDLPEYIAENGGLIGVDFVQNFTQYGKFILQEYGNDLDYIATFNEPFVQCSSSYLTDGRHGQWPLGDSDQDFVKAIEQVIICNAKIIQIHKQLQLKSKIGIVIDFSPGYERSKYNNYDVEASIFYTAFRESLLLEPSINGKYCEVFAKINKRFNIKSLFANKENVELIKNNTIQWLGVNYYTPVWIKEGKKNPERIKELFNFWDNPIALMNKSRGWEIKPDSLYDIGLRLKNGYKNILWMVTENGIAIENEAEDYIYNGMIQDDYRIDFFKMHLDQLFKLVKNGANCFGYLMWTPIDSWSFMNAYKNRYGLISLDLKTYKKTIKKSGYWWKKMVEDGGY